MKLWVRVRVIQQTPTSTATPQPQLRAESRTNRCHTADLAHSKPDNMVFLRDLSFLQHREFKVHGGQVGDNTSDISYHGLCKQIDEGLMAKYTESEIIQGVLCIIKPGQFKDMLINKDDLTLSELGSFLHSHLSEKSGSELFQELMSTKQHEHESPQQFLYRMIGLKQKVMFASRQGNKDIEYEFRTVQNVFLRTIHQGLLPKYSDIRNELKPLLADYSVSDEALIRQVNKVSSEESERQRRLGYSARQKWVKTYLPDHELRPLAELIGQKDLSVLTANGTVLPYEGWVGAMVSLPNSSDPNMVIQVPFLVSSVPLNRPLIGFNVVERLILGSEDDVDLIPTLVSLIRSAMGLQEDKATALVSLIQTKSTNQVDLSQGVLKVGSHDVVIPAGQVRYVKCRIPPTFNTSKALVLFEPSDINPQLQQLDVGNSLIEICQAKVPYVRVPIGNHMKHDVTLPCKTPLGSIESVVRVVQTGELGPATISVTPRADGDDGPRVQLNKGGRRDGVEPWDPPVDISHLNED
ncbi:uncharacterized protein [Paramormyrops kingsleyae]|uniref:uncharacterized protein n=1 Tax=Paramormyrops kingsleyae TaxID=1676925 RepID=UPI003B9785D9